MYSWWSELHRLWWGNLKWGHSVRLWGLIIAIRCAWLYEWLWEKLVGVHVYSSPPWPLLAPTDVCDVLLMFLLSDVMVCMIGYVPVIRFLDHALCALTGRGMNRSWNRVWKLSIHQTPSPFFCIRCVCVCVCVCVCTCLCMHVQI